VIDEYVVRDHENFAFLPGSEIKGLVRDSCVTLLQRLDRWKNICEGQKDWHRMERLLGEVRVEEFCAFKPQPLCVLCALFGSPAGKGGWWFSPASYDEDNYKEVVRRADQEGSLRLAWRDQAVSAHASIDYETKRAAEDQLFNLEVIHPHSSWVGRVERISSPLAPPSASSQPNVSGEHLLGWLTMALLFTRRIGGRRRRGWGRCRFEVSEGVCRDNKAALQTLDALLLEIAGHGAS
jgi:CRISPR/Cas system CSM-associated protein Csm3 (group 7 of RAMP superfamily)